MSVTGILYLLFLSFSTSPHRLPIKSANKKNGTGLQRRMWGRRGGDGEAPGGVRTHSSQIFTALTNSTKMYQFSRLMGQKTFWQGMNMGILSRSPPSGCMLFWQFIVTQTMGIRFNCTSHWLLAWFIDCHRFCIIVLELRASTEREHLVCSLILFVLLWIIH